MAWYDKWAIMVIATAISVVGYKYIRWDDVDATIVAYWLQAIGSIVAIFGAFAIGNSQNRHNRQIAADLADEAVRRKWSSIKAVVDDLHQQILDTQAAFSEINKEFDNLAFIFRYNEKYFELSMSRVNAIPIFELESDQLVTSIVSFQRLASAMHTWISTAQDIILGRDTEFECNVQDIKELALQTIENAKVAYGRIVDVTGGIHIKPKHDVFGRQD
ncbi:hypothetical protein KIV45_15745 [Janthinobacterium lividum]|nr:hypothetical protein KIV45_15745 [Janthinobacterium lividum]